MTGTLSSSLFFFLTSIWWGWTFLVDFFVIRTVFSVVDSFWTAGKLGMALFTKLNLLELVVSTVIVAILAIDARKKRKFPILLMASLVVWIIAMTYFSYLTPKLVALTDLWQQGDLIGVSSFQGIPDIQQEHQFYHNLYIGLDSVKFLTLGAMLGFAAWKKEPA